MQGNLTVESVGIFEWSWEEGYLMLYCYVHVGVKV